MVSLPRLRPALYHGSPPSASPKPIRATFDPARHHLAPATLNLANHTNGCPVTQPHPLRSKTMTLH